MYVLNIPFKTFLATLDHTLGNCQTILDVGCGGNSPLHHLPRRKYTVGVDGYAPDIESSKKNNWHDLYYVSDIQTINKQFPLKSFDAVIALDVIEHLHKPAGEKLLAALEAIAQKRVIVLTPNGFIRQAGRDNKLQEHLSGWSVADLEAHGYTVQGMYGWKPLRKEEASLRFRPKLFWGFLSELTHHAYTRNHPEYAFSLMAWKDVGS